MMKNQNFALLLIVLSLVSCEEKSIGGDEKPAAIRDSVPFVISSIPGSGTRSECEIPATSIPSSILSVYVPDCGQEFFLVETISYMGTDYDGAVATRATMVDDNNFNTKYGTELYATPYMTKSSGEYDDPWGVSGPTQLTLSNGKYVFSYGSKSIAWPDDNQLMFLFQAPYTTRQGLSNLTFKADGHVTFGYADPGVANQKDLLFGKSVASVSDDENSVTLYHALSAVQFSAGNTSWDNTSPDKDVTTNITKVTFKSMYSSGQCDINLGASSGYSDTRSTWTGTGDAIDYVMDFSGTSLPATASDSGTLLLVPQSVAGKQIDIEFKVVRDDVESDTYHCTVALPSDAAAWKAGEIHKFSLVSNRVEVNVAPNDDSGNTVVLSNTGNVPVYLRAGYVVDWNTSSGTCIPADEAEGCFAGLPAGDETDEWIKGEDDFFYYKYPLKPGCRTSPLYTSFTKPTATPMVQGSTPQLSIILQGITFDANKTAFGQAWGTSVKDANNTSRTVYEEISQSYK